MVVQPKVTPNLTAQLKVALDEEVRPNPSFNGARRKRRGRPVKSDAMTQGR